TGDFVHRAQCRTGGNRIDSKHFSSADWRRCSRMVQTGQNPFTGACLAHLKAVFSTSLSTELLKTFCDAGGDAISATSRRLACPRMPASETVRPTPKVRERRAA